MNYRTIFGFFIITFLFEHTAWAYIDPGSGGYLISSVLTGLAGIFALTSAFVIHFFRNIIGKTCCLIWQKYRFLSVICILVILTGAGLWAYRMVSSPAVKKRENPGKRENGGLAGKFIV